LAAASQPITVKKDNFNEIIGPIDINRVREFHFQRSPERDRTLEKEYVKRARYSQELDKPSEKLSKSSDRTIDKENIKRNQTPEEFKRKFQNQGKKYYKEKISSKKKT